ncbi:hypothetical protein SCP_0601490 [Sparassis crispa]|uniref:Uncharacterized protein n=1 Tax=Sparassis crispa TaxID=139825 RepID=A0A401GPK6_9APHY|nr:hypothetical protein SCP_0601490 [Sparassis crispa]GBE84171.1 hypothetical protein SCP_0601490 [Sparassis crispa]
MSNELACNHRSTPEEDAKQAVSGGERRLISVSLRGGPALLLDSRPSFLDDVEWAWSTVMSRACPEMARWSESELAARGLMGGRKKNELITVELRVGRKFVVERGLIVLELIAYEGLDGESELLQGGWDAKGIVVTEMTPIADRKVAIRRP